MPIVKRQEAPLTPPALKKALIAILILCSVGGFAFQAVGFIFLGRGLLSEGMLSADQLSESFAIPHAPFERFDFLDKAKLTLPKKSLYTFQGTLTGETGSIALINGEMAAAGALIDGVKILSISNRTLTIQRHQETLTLHVGDSFEPAED